MDNNYEYKIIEPNEKDPTAIVIEKSNISVEFTIADMLDEQQKIQRYIDQFNGQKLHEEMKLKNIIEHHPFILKMSEQDLFTAHMYQEAMAIVKTLEDKLPELTEQLEGSKAEMALICEKLGISLEKDVDWDAAVNELVEDGTEDTHDGE